MEAQEDCILQAEIRFKDVLKNQCWYGYTEIQMETNMVLFIGKGQASWTQRGFNGLKQYVGSRLVQTKCSQ